MKKLIVHVHAIFMFVCVIGLSAAFCQEQKTNAGESASLFQGRFDNNTYINDFFGFRVVLPSEGVVLNKAQVEVFKNAGADLIKSEDQQNNRRIENEIGKQTTLVNYLSKPLGSADNSNIVIGATKQAPGATANLVLAATLRELAPSGKFELVESIKSVKIGGVDFAGLVGKLNVNGQSINTKTLVSIRKGYSLEISVSYVSESGKKSVEALINSIEFSVK